MSQEQSKSLTRALAALQELRAKLESVERARTEPIAVIGMGCRFPGGADSPAAFWRLLDEATDAVGETPVERWDAEALHAADPDAPGKVSSRHGAYLQNVDAFDPYFFGISPREAAAMDPQQRLLLEVAWEALENAGQETEALRGSRTGVFVGVHSHSNDYFWLAGGAPASMDYYLGTGTAHNVLSGRLAYLLDARGPALAVDTACSSSLVAIHLACTSLRSGESTLALVGGVNLMLSPLFTIAASRMRVLSADGRCKTFDARADGFGRGEGCGVVVLKRLSAAIADRDPVLAIIRGSAVNQDGHSNGLAAPNGPAQQAVIREALANARVAPADITYVETHGTGTPLGDPIEVEALVHELGAGSRPCVLGAVKTNIGHLEGAAGVAGLIKTVLALQHRRIPANLHFEQLNPHISLAGTRLEVADHAREWNSDGGPRYAGVSSFGWSGTNAHLILQEAPAEPGAPDQAGDAMDRPQILTLSARHPDALVALARKYASALAETDAAPRDIAYTAAVRRTHHDYRLAIAGATRAEWIARLTAWTRESAVDAAHGSAGHARVPAPQIAFVLPGQGSQWVGMARELLAHEPVFAGALAACQTALAPYANWSIAEQLASDQPRFDAIDVIQPLLFAVQVALARLWQSWGIEPEAVVGHSMGEVAAAHIAGALTLEDASCVICCRSRLMKSVSGQGGMAVVGLTLAAAHQELSGYQDLLAVAASNGPRTTVLSGDADALDKVLTRLRARNVFARRIQVDVASHSPQMVSLRDALRQQLSAIRPLPARIPIYSTVTANRIDGAALDADYWARNLCQPVLFTAATTQMIADGFSIFVEISPHPVLCAAVQETAEHMHREVVTAVSLERNAGERMTMLAALGTLYTSGCRIEWGRWYERDAHVVPLPTYPWQHQRFWLAAGPVETADVDGLARGIRHPLLGTPLPLLATNRKVHAWQNRLGARVRRELGIEHAVPESVFRSMALAAACFVYGDKLHRLTEMTLDAPLSLETGEPVVQLVLTETGDGTAQVQVLSQVGADWKLHARGALALSETDADCLYQFQWQLAPRSTSQDVRLPGHWLILDHASGRAPALLESIVRRGGSATVVRVGSDVAGTPESRLVVDAERRQDFLTLFADEHAPYQGVVYLGGGATQLDDPGDGTTLPELQLALCRGVLFTIQAMAQRAVASRLWIVTQQAATVTDQTLPLKATGLRAAPDNGASIPQFVFPGKTGDRTARGPNGMGEAEQRQVTSDAIPSNCAGASLWGLARVVANEHPELWGGLVDLGAGADIDVETEMLCDELMAGEARDQVALRAGRRYAGRIVRYNDAGTVPVGLPIGADATYLITGGLGGVGLAVAQWLVAQGARHLVLIGRRSPSLAASEIVSSLVAAGAEVRVLPGDVTQADSVAQLLAEVARTMPPLRGILHLAAVLDDGVLQQLDAARVANVLAPKVRGAWNLHAQTLDLPLDFLVLFSSATSLLGLPGQANYAAGNAFMDALAAYRRASGRPAVSINWGIWGNAGLATRTDRLDNLARRGLGVMEPSAALDALAYLLPRAMAGCAVMRMDWDTYRTWQPRPAGMYAEWNSAHPVAPPVPDDLVAQLSSVPPAERLSRLVAAVRDQVVAVMRFPPEFSLDPDQGFFALGMDSLMAVELKNRLRSSLAVPLPSTLAFDYPTVTTLARYLNTALFPVAAQDAPAGDDGLTQVAHLSRDELKDLLEDELGAVEREYGNGHDD